MVALSTQRFWSAPAFAVNELLNIITWSSDEHNSLVIVHLNIFCPGPKLVTNEFGSVVSSIVAGELTFVQTPVPCEGILASRVANVPQTI